MRLQLGSADGKAAVAAAAREGFRGKRDYLSGPGRGRAAAAGAGCLSVCVGGCGARGRGAGGGLLLGHRRAGWKRDDQHGAGYCGAGESASGVCRKKGGTAEALDCERPMSAVAGMHAGAAATEQRAECGGLRVRWWFGNMRSRRGVGSSARGCPANQAPDGKCYAPGLAQSAETFVDLNTADSADPSEGR